MNIDSEKAHQAIAAKIAEPLALEFSVAAHGMLRIANANMGRAIRSVSTERGYDVSDFALVAFGGAGPLHAAEVAEECGIPRVIIPQEPGTMCARGMLLSDISLDFVRTEIAIVDPQTWSRICGLFEEMHAEASAWLEREQVKPAQRSFKGHIEARYIGQNYEVKVPATVEALGEMAHFVESFAEFHKKEYGYAIPGREVEIVNCRLQAVGAVPKAPIRRIDGGRSLEQAQCGKRQVHFGGDGSWVHTPVYARHELPIEKALAGPAIVEEMSATTVILPGQSARMDAFGNLHLASRHLTDQQSRN